MVNQVIQHGHIGLQTQAWTSRGIQPEKSYRICSYRDFQETSRRFPRDFQETSGEEFPRKWRPGDLQPLPSCIKSGEARGGNSALKALRRLQEVPGRPKDVPAGLFKTLGRPWGVLREGIFGIPDTPGSPGESR